MTLNKFAPSMYKKSIFDVNYDLLKKKGIKCLIFDFDNTVSSVNTKSTPKENLQLLKKLKENFKIIIVSNNFKRKIKPICDKIEIEFISFAVKPLARSFKKVIKKYKFSKDEICIIGDQLVSDILGGNKFGIMTILIEPLSTKDLKITKFNRFIEKKILARLEESNILERGKYYE